MALLLVMPVLCVLSFSAMEGVAWVSHRYLMHGLLWCWHRSHHEPRRGVLELNDLFGVVFALPAIALFWFAAHGRPLLWPVGLGITLYGAVYLFFHDGLVHGRFPLRRPPFEAFWTRRIQAHRLHHAVASREGCVSYGFLWVRPARELKRQLRALADAAG